MADGNVAMNVALATEVVKIGVRGSSRFCCAGTIAEIVDGTTSPLSSKSNRGSIGARVECAGVKTSVRLVSDELVRGAVGNGALNAAGASLARFG